MKKNLLAISTLFCLSLVIGGANVFAGSSDDLDYEKI